jgi:predicted ester cyclase
MSLPSNKELWLSWSALWNGNLSIADEIIAPNFIAHFAPIGNSPAEVHGPDALKQWIGATVGAFTDYSFTTTVGPLVDEDHVAGRWLFRAIYQGGIPGASPGAVGKQVEYAGMDLFRVEAGKIVEYWLCADTLQLLQQVGVIPS